MASKPSVNEAIALTEKKVGMALDDIIRMSRDNHSKTKKQRVSNRGPKFVKNSAQDRNQKVRRFIDTRSSLRQGALSQKRSKFQENQFPLATDAAKKAAFAPIRNRAFGRSRPFNMNKLRHGAPTKQKDAANEISFIVKKPVGHFSVGPGAKKTQTLDLMFANMKEQRMKAFSQKTTGPRRNHARN